MISQTDINGFETFLDSGGILTVTLFGSTRILQKIEGYYTLYTPESTMQSPMTVRQCLENLLLWRKQQIARHEEMRRRSFVFDVVEVKRSVA